MDGHDSYTSYTCMECSQNKKTLLQKNRKKCKPSCGKSCHTVTMSEPQREPLQAEVLLGSSEWGGEVSGLVKGGG